MRRNRDVTDELGDIIRKTQAEELAIEDVLLKVIEDRYMEDLRDLVSLSLDQDVQPGTKEYLVGMLAFLMCNKIRRDQENRLLEELRAALAEESEKEEGD